MSDGVIEFDFTLACPPAHAFDVWTGRALPWWPPEHTMSHDPRVVVTFEPRVGGRIFERTPDGTEHDWGEILVWEPPHRIAYTWRIATDASNATRVEITFEPHDGDTRVRIRHDGWDALGTFGSRWRATNRLGWDGVLPTYREVAERTA